MLVSVLPVNIAPTVSCITSARATLPTVIASASNVPSISALPEISNVVAANVASSKSASAKPVPLTSTVVLGSACKSLNNLNLPLSLASANIPLNFCVSPTS